MEADSVGNEIKDMESMALMRSDGFEMLAMESAPNDPYQGDVSWVVKLQSASFRDLSTYFFI